ncbi:MULTISPECIES: hypothetical protein [unclassified Streptomyces]|uniref:hypothetical protein n=1 Tax=unclassified Streptomyces TaxID=2593676 RepID=UPI00332EFEBA
MNRPLRLATSALAVSAALLLSSCGSSDDGSKDSDKIAGAENGGEEKSPSPSAPDSEAVERPKVDLPADLTYTFDWPKTGKKADDAILADSEQSIKAVDMAIAEQDPANKAYRFYYEGEAAAQTQKFIQAYVDAKARTTGAYRYYNPEVSGDGGSASLVYCEDQSKAYDKYLKKDKVKKTPATKNSYVLYAAKLQKNDAGVWVTTQINSTRGSAKCQP